MTQHSKLFEATTGATFVLLRNQIAKCFNFRQYADTRLDNHPFTYGWNKKSLCLLLSITNYKGSHNILTEVMK